jgi:hypothetical protein
LEIYCAFAPEKISTITTSLNGPNVRISWSEPIDNGAIVTSYSIYIQQKDTTYTIESVYCDGTSNDLLTNKECEVPLTVLYAAPFLLDGGSSVYAKISATNSQGTSEVSDPGNGAQIVFVPDAPQ